MSATCVAELEATAASSSSFVGQALRLPKPRSCKRASPVFGGGFAPNVALCCQTNVNDPLYLVAWGWDPITPTQITDLIKRLNALQVHNSKSKVIPGDHYAFVYWNDVVARP